MDKNSEKLFFKIVTPMSFAFGISWTLWIMITEKSGFHSFVILKDIGFFLLMSILMSGGFYMSLAAIFGIIHWLIFDKSWQIKDWLSRFTNK